MATAEDPKIAHSQTTLTTVTNPNATNQTPKHFPEISTYYMKNPYVIVIGIHDYDQLGNLEGVATDMPKMKNLWKNCYNYTINTGYTSTLNDQTNQKEITPKMKWTVAEIESFLEVCRGEIATYEHDSLIFVLTCHGDRADVNGITRDCLIDSARSYYPLQTLFDFFSGRACYWLRDKPKVFFLDLCRGSSSALPLRSPADENDTDEKKSDIDNNNNNNNNNDNNDSNNDSNNVKTKRMNGGNMSKQQKKKKAFVSNDSHYVYIYATTHGNASIDGGTVRGGYLIDAVNTILKEINWVEMNNLNTIIEYIKKETEQNVNSNQRMMIPEFKKTGTMFIYLRKKKHSDNSNSLNHSNIGWSCSVCDCGISSPKALFCEYCRSPRPASNQDTKDITIDSSAAFAVESDMDQVSSEVEALKTYHPDSVFDSPKIQKPKSLDDDDIKEEEIAKAKKKIEKAFQLRFDNLQAQLRQMKKISAKGNTEGLYFVQNKLASHYNTDFGDNIGKIELISGGFIRKFIDISNNNSDIINPIINYVGTSFNAMKCTINVVKNEHSTLGYYHTRSAYQEKLLFSQPLNENEEIYLKLVESNCIHQDWWKNNGYDFSFGLIGINNKCITNDNYCTLAKLLEIFENADLSKYKEPTMPINPLLALLSDNNINSDAICIYGLRLSHDNEMPNQCYPIVNVSETLIERLLDDDQHTGLIMRIYKENHKSILTFWSENDKLLGEYVDIGNPDVNFGRFYLKPNYHYIPYFQSSTCDCNENGFKFEITKRDKRIKVLPAMSIVSQKMASGYQVAKDVWKLLSAVIAEPNILFAPLL